MSVRGGLCNLVGSLIRHSGAQSERQYAKMQTGLCAYHAQNTLCPCPSVSLLPRTQLCWSLSPWTPGWPHGSCQTAVLTQTSCQSSPPPGCCSLPSAESQSSKWNFLLAASRLIVSGSSVRFFHSPRFNIVSNLTVGLIYTRINFCPRPQATENIFEEKIF